MTAITKHKMQPAKAIAILLISFQTTTAVLLGCKFEMNLYDYSCRMTSTFTESNQPVTVVGGSHASWKRNSQVVLLNVPADSTTSYLPTNLCSRFSLTKFDVNSKALVEISRSVFTGCTKVERIKIANSQIAWLPEDTFYDLSNLVYLEMVGNKLEILQKNMFPWYIKLKQINLDQNQLAIINTNFPTTLTLLSLKGNVCIDKSFPGEVSTIGKMNSDCQELCTHAGFKKAKSALDVKINDLETAMTVNAQKVNRLEIEKIDFLSKMKLLEKEKENQKQINSELREAQNNLFLNISQLSITNDEKSEEIQLLSSNHSEAQEKIEELFAEIINLKQNISLAEFVLSDKNEIIESCSTEKNYLNETLQRTNSNLSALATYSEAMEEKLLELEQVNEQLNVTVNGLNVELIEVRSNLNSSEGEIDELKSKIFEMDLNITDASDNCSSVISDLSGTLNETNWNIAVLKLSNNQLEIQNADLKRNLIEQPAALEAPILVSDTYVIISCCLIILISVGWITTIILYIRKRNSVDEILIDMKAIDSTDM